MEKIVTGSVPAPPRKPDAAEKFLPATAAGWWALAFSAAGIALWVVLGIAATIIRSRVTAFDIWLLAAAPAFLIDIAAVLCVLAVWRRKENTALFAAALAGTIPMALVITPVVVFMGFVWAWA